MLRVGLSCVVLLALSASESRRVHASTSHVADGPTIDVGAGLHTVAAWTLCASETQTCVFDGTRQVRYGTATQYVTGVHAARVSCSDDVFGHPAIGGVKSCRVASRAEAAPDGAWIDCASENQFCAFSGTRAVRYGAGATDRMATATDGIACSSEVFGDPDVGAAKTCAYAAIPIADAPVDPGRSSGTDPPVVFNASGSVRPGDVAGLQGEGFGASPRVYLEDAPHKPLEIVNRTGSGWLAVQIPADARAALKLRIANDTGTSARIVLNGATPLHLDAMQLVPGGRFRVFGRSLRAAGRSPTVTVDGLAATVDVARSDDGMLSVVAPIALRATTAAAIVVDNGNGSGGALLDRTIEVVAAGSADPFALGVGWATVFGSIAGIEVDAARDPRLPRRVACDGRTDDGPAIRASIDLAASLGGGVVRLPAGRCRLATGVELRSRVVVLGAGRDDTVLVYEADYPVRGVHVDASGIGHLTLTNAGGAAEGPLLKDSTRVFLQDLRVHLGTSRQMYLSGNRNVVIAHAEFMQTAGVSGQGPYVLNDSSGLVFEGNTTRWANGAPAFGRVHDSYVHANRFTRDGAVQDTGGVVHAMTIDFAHRLAIVGNTFDVVDGPITNHRRNDGEALLTEGGGAARTENVGTVSSATATTLSDPRNTFVRDPFDAGSLPENYGVAIVAGKGAGQSRRVMSIAGTTLTVDRAWAVVPDGGSRYATFVWGLEKASIRGNRFMQNPRGIWLYQTAIRDVEVTGNDLSEGGGIYLRAYQNLATRMFTPIWNVLIAGNRVSNTTREWPSYLNAVFVNADARDFGIAMLGIEMRANEVIANRPALALASEEYAGSEGMTNMMRVENYEVVDLATTPRVLGSLLTGNTCTACEFGVRIGTGASGTTILNTRLVDTPVLLTDSLTTTSGGRSVDTVTR